MGVSCQKPLRAAMVKAVKDHALWAVALPGNYVAARYPAADLGAQQMTDEKHAHTRAAQFGGNKIRQIDRTNSRKDIGSKPRQSRLPDCERRRGRKPISGGDSEADRPRQRNWPETNPPQGLSRQAQSSRQKPTS
jgi:hypothetical protein